jgi:hypothetical protein
VRCVDGTSRYVRTIVKLTFYTYTYSCYYYYYYYHYFCFIIGILLFVNIIISVITVIIIIIWNVSLFLHCLHFVYFSNVILFLLRIFFITFNFCFLLFAFCFLFSIFYFLLSAYYILLLSPTLFPLVFHFFYFSFYECSGDVFKNIENLYHSKIWVKKKEIHWSKRYNINHCLLSSLGSLPRLLHFCISSKRCCYF